MPTRRPTKRTAARQKDWTGYPDVEVTAFEHLPAYSSKLKDRAEWCTEHAAEIADALYAKYEDAGADVLSLDVFDTVLLRNDIPEAERYAAMSELALAYLHEDGFDKDRRLSADDLLLARANGMVFAYRTAPKSGEAREGNIDTVYLYMISALGLEEGADACLRRAEIDYEVSVMKPNPAIARLMEMVREYGGRIILLSDMYLPGNMIETLVEQIFEIAPPFDLVFSSADSGHSKRGGSAFAHVEASLDLNGETVFHIGDSLQSDVRNPRDHGWQSMCFPLSQEEQYQRSTRLNRFVTKMRKSGLDVSRWAKA